MRFLLVGIHEGYKEEIGEHLDIVERENIIVLWIFTRGQFFGLEFHVAHDLEAIVSPMRGAHGEGDECRLEVGHVVRDPGFIRFIEDLADEIDARFGSGTVLLSNCVFDEVANMQLILEFPVVDHRLLSFGRKP